MMRLPSTKTVLIGAALVLGGSAAAVGVLRAVDTEDLMSVRVATPADGDIAAYVSTNGRVLPQQDFQARAAQSGVVDKIYVHVGDQVVAGAPLIDLRDPFAASRYTGAVAGLKSAQLADENIRGNGSREDLIHSGNDLEHARRDIEALNTRLALLQGLQKSGAATQAEVADALGRRDNAQLDLDALRKRMTTRYSPEELASVDARVRDAKANITTARQILANVHIVAPRAGTVYSLNVLPYDFVNPGADLVHLTDLNALKVAAYFDEPDVGSLHASDRAEITWEARPGVVWHGHITQVPLTVGPLGTRSVGECDITIDDARGDLLPNTNVTVRIVSAEHRNALTIPRQALQTQDAERFVYRVVDGRAVRTAVTTGIINLDRVEITHGVGPNDTLVTQALPGAILKDGASLRVAP